MDSILSILSKLLEPVPPGSWVAISERDRKVVAFDPDSQVALAEAKKKGEAIPLMVKKPLHAQNLFFSVLIGRAKVSPRFQSIPFPRHS
jgi:hypothetical protein